LVSAEAHNAAHEDGIVRRVVPQGERLIVFSQGLGALVIDSSASFRGCGMSLPRSSALRNIPRHASLLKEYFSAGCVSKTCDNEDTTAALGNSEELSVKHPVCDTIPEVCQPP